MTEETKDKLMSETLKYLGKTLKGSGTKDDKDWKSWQLQFETDGQYEWKCKCWDSIKGGPVKELEEGKYYEIVYKIQEWTSPEHGLVKSKQAVLLKPAVESDCTKDNLGQANTKKEEQSTPSQGYDMDKVKKIAIVYHKQVDPEERSLNHFIGTVIKTVNKESVEEIIKLYQDTFGSK